MKKIQLEVRLKSQREINDLARKHADKRYVEEQRVFKETTRRTTKEFAATTRRATKDFTIQQRLAQESQERKSRIEMEDARLQAE